MNSASRIVFIRADASTQIGTGHVTRCLSLAEACKEHGWSVVFMSNCENEVLRSRIQAVAELLSIEGICPDPSDVEMMMQVIRERGGWGRSSWLVLDGYHFDSEYQKAVRESGVRLLVVDDFQHCESYHADIILDQNLGSDSCLYPCVLSSTRLLGPDYVVLRKSFRKVARRSKRRVKTPLRIMITMGGADANNATGLVMDAFQNLQAGVERVRVAVGSSNSNIKDLEEGVRRCALAGLEVKLEQNADMFEMMDWADLAVSAGGTTCWELAYMGVPFVVVVVADNQLELARELDKAEVAVNVGRIEDLDEEYLVSCVGKLLNDKERREKLASAGKLLVDGQGVERIIKAMR